MAAPRVPSISSEVSAAIQRALRPGASPFARLGLPDALCETSVLRRAYRTAALLIHPDKCAHPEAKMAFQKLSEAFDVLSGPEGQQQQLDGPKGAIQGAHMNAEAAMTGLHHLDVGESVRKMSMDRGKEAGSLGGTQASQTSRSA